MPLKAFVINISPRPTPDRILKHWYRLPSKPVVKAGLFGRAPQASTCHCISR